MQTDRNLATCIRLAFGAIALGALVGCQNSYSRFHTKVINEHDETYLLPFSGRTEFFSTEDYQVDASLDVIYKRGYRMIGHSSFEANSGDYSNELKQYANELGADIVLVASKSAGTMTGVLPIVSYTPGESSTSYTTGTATARATSGVHTAYATANYSAASTTTTSGSTSTTWIPYSVERTRYSAAFFRRSAWVFGAAYQSLTEAEWVASGKNAGVRVTALVDRGPAFLGNVLVGDILLTIDGETIYSQSHFDELLRARAGSIVKIVVQRKDKAVEIEIPLGHAPAAAPRASR
jgi:hypothetical protein